MPRYKMNYQEGYAFAVPLVSGGFAIGIAARLSKKSGGVLGYFGGRRFRDVPSLDDANSLRPANAIWIANFGDLGLVRNEWPVLGLVANWRKDEWPVPPMGLFAEHLGHRMASVIELDPDDIGRTAQRVAVSVEKLEGLFVGGLFGARAVQIVLDRYLPSDGAQLDRKIQAFDSTGAYMR